MRLLALLACLTSPLAAQQAVLTGRGAEADATIRILVPHGSVRISAWGRDSVAVRGRLDPAAGRLVLDGTRESLRIAIEAPARPRGTGLADLEISVPRNARLRIAGAGVSLDCIVEGGELTAFTTSGKVRVVGTLREVEIETLDGNVELAVTAPVARVRTASGTVVVRGVVQALDVSSVSGPLLIGMEGPIASARLESTSAAISFKGDLTREGRLLADTHGGDVDLRLPPRLEATWHLANYGGILDNQLLPEDLVRPGPRKGEWRFVTGNGLARVEVRTFKGTVRLQARPLER